jgi:hypothetical protein
MVMKNLMFIFTLVAIVAMSSCDKESITPNVKVGDKAGGGIVGSILDDESLIIITDFDLSDGADWETAVNLCENYTGGGHSDWVLPTLYDLQQIDKGYPLPKLDPYNDQIDYWTSTEIPGDARAFKFPKLVKAWTPIDGLMHPYDKRQLYRVRAVRVHQR